MAGLSEAHRFSWQAWENRQEDGADLPAVLNFMFWPDDFRDSGLYIGLVDFQDLKLGWDKNVAISTAFHALVYHFSQPYPVIYEQARQDLYQNQANAYYGYSRRYFLLGSALLPYADEPPRPGFKIKDIGKFGRELLRGVLYDPKFPMEPTGAELFGEPPVDITEE